MAIGYTELDFVDGQAPALSAANLNHMDEGIKACADQLDLESAPGRALVEAETVAAQRTALDVDSKAEVTAKADAAQSAAESTAASALAGHVSASDPHTQYQKESEVSTTPGANIIPKAGADSKLAAGFIPQATSAAIGGALLGASGGAAKLTKMPDGATAVYASNFATVDGWTRLSAGGTVSVSGGELICAAGTNGAYKALDSSHSAKTVLARVKLSGAGTVALRLGSTTLSSISVPGGVYVIITAILPVLASGNLSIYVSDSLLAATVNAVWIGDYSYLPGSLSEEAARIADQLGDTAGVGVAASGTITSNGTNVSAGDTVTIAGKVYTFVSTISATRVEGEVLIGADAALSLVNLYHAVNHRYPAVYDYNGSAPVYNCAAPNPLVYFESSGLGGTFTAGYASGAIGTTLNKVTGEQGNSITLAKSAATLTLSGATLTGGYSDAAAKIITATQNNIAGSGTRPAAAKIELTNTALIGYETTVDVASGGTFTLPAGGTWYWNVYGYGATISSAKRGSSAGGTTLTVAGANASVGYRRVA